MHDPGALDDLQKAVCESGREAIGRAERPGIHGDGQHGAEGQRTTHGHGEQLHVAEHERKAHAERSIDERAHIHTLAGLFFRSALAQAYEQHNERHRRNDCRDEHHEFLAFELGKLFQQNEFHFLTLLCDK